MTDPIDNALDKMIAVALVFLIAVIIVGALVTAYKWLTGQL